MLTEESTATLCEVLSNMEKRLLTSFICHGLQKTSTDKYQLQIERWCCLHSSQSDGDAPVGILWQRQCLWMGMLSRIEQYAKDSENQNFDIIIEFFQELLLPNKLKLYHEELSSFSFRIHLSFSFLHKCSPCYCCFRTVLYVLIHSNDSTFGIAGANNK